MEARSALSPIFQYVGMTPPAVYQSFIKDYCPFHQSPSSQTFWMSTATGFWGCHSRRCTYHTSGEGNGFHFDKFLEAHGVPEDLRLATLADLEWAGFDHQGGTQTTQISIEETTGDSFEDVSASAILRWSDIYMWSVDWEMVQHIWETVRSVPGWVFRKNEPLDSWCNSGASKDSVEYKFWEPLGWLLNERSITTSTLTKAQVGFCPRSGELVYPLFDDKRIIYGASRRKPAAGCKAIHTGTAYLPGDIGFRKVGVHKGKLMYGSGWHTYVEGPLNVVEGQNDQLRLQSLGFDVMAKLGDKLNRRQAEILAKTGRVICLWPDATRTGLIFVAADIAKLSELGVSMMVVLPSYYGGAEDPGELTSVAAIEAFSNRVAAWEFQIGMNSIISSLAENKESSVH